MYESSVKNINDKEMIETLKEVVSSIKTNDGIDWVAVTLAMQFYERVKPAGWRDFYLSLYSEMRDLTPEEEKCVSKAMEKLSEKTGVSLFDTTSISSSEVSESEDIIISRSISVTLTSIGETIEELSNTLSDKEFLALLLKVQGVLNDNSSTELSFYEVLSHDEGALFELEYGNATRLVQLLDGDLYICDSGDSLKSCFNLQDIIFFKFKKFQQD